MSSQVESRIGHVFDNEAHLAQTADNVVSLVLWTVSKNSTKRGNTRNTYAEVRLEVNHLILDQRGFKHGDSSLLEGVTGTAIKIATAGTNTRGTLVYFNRIL